MCFSTCSSMWFEIKWKLTPYHLTPWNNMSQRTWQVGWMAEYSSQFAHLLNLHSRHRLDVCWWFWIVNRTCKLFWQLSAIIVLDRFIWSMRPGDVWRCFHLYLRMQSFSVRAEFIDSTLRFWNALTQRAVGSVPVKNKGGGGGDRAASILFLELLDTVVSRC